MKRLSYLSLIRVLLICIGFLSYQLKAEPTYGLPDSLSSRATVSILVASPSSEEIYTLYGHAGLRVVDPEQNLDVTFNYGIFNFDDGFIFRFIQGKTDYIVLPQHSSEYIESYVGRGSSVRELILSTTPKIRGEMWKYLLFNIQPENRTYRYNFFYDNCSTRPISILSNALRQSIPQQGDKDALSLIPISNERTTWRREINLLEREYPWLVLGTDLALGSPTDEEISVQELLFLPHYLEPILSSATIQGETTLPVLREVKVYGEEVTHDYRSRWDILHPTIIASIIFLICGLLAIRLAFRGAVKWSNLIDIGLWFCVGLVGTILLYIGLGTEHPNTWPNYNIIVFNPLLLWLGIPVLWSNSNKRLRFSLHFFNFVLQTGFILIAPILPQHFNAVVYIMALSLSTLSIGRILEDKRLPR